jgi:hypothetical protein
MVMGTILVAWANFMVGRACWPAWAACRGAAGPVGLVRSGENGLAADCLRFAMFIPATAVRILAANGLMVMGLLYFSTAFASSPTGSGDGTPRPLFRGSLYFLIAIQQYLAIVVAALGLFDMCSISGN